MHRPAWQRLSSALFAIWFVVVMAEPAALHSCPLHDAPAPGSMHHHGAMMAAHHMGHAAHTGGSEQDASRHCTCMGACCATSPVAILAPHVDLVGTSTILVADGGLPSYQYLPVAAPHVLPFPNGPPPGV